MDEKKYRMTSNQMLKGIFKQNDSEISKLRSTFMKINNNEQSKKKIGHYTIIKEIGKGGFAQVYEVAAENGKRYALKEYNLQNALECYHNESNIGDYFFSKGTVKQ
jgi:serine/threonine protein kinase